MLPNAHSKTKKTQQQISLSGEIKAFVRKKAGLLKVLFFFGCFVQNFLYVKFCDENNVYGLFQFPKS